MLLEVLIEMSIKCWLIIWWSCQKTAFNADTSNALTGFRCCQKCCTWRWNDQMHWRIFDDVRKAALWWSNALTNFRFCQKAAFDAETIKCIDGFPSFCQKTEPDAETIRCIDRFDDDVKKTVSDFETIRYIDEFSIFDADRSAGERTRPQTNKQNETSNETMFVDC